MGYYAQGDYYQQGDLFGFIKGVGRTIGGAATGLVTGGLTGAIAGGIRGATGGGRRPSVPQIHPRVPVNNMFQPPPPGGGSMSGINIGGQRGITIGRRNIGPGEVVGFPEMPMVQMPRRRRRMNYGNVKALRRADRRIDGFVKVARKALAHTNYKVVSKSAGTRTRSAQGVHVHTSAKAD